MNAYATTPAEFEADAALRKLRYERARQSPHRKVCVDREHPGATYNPWYDATWCACGEVIARGNTVAADYEPCCGWELVSDPVVLGSVSHRSVGECRK